MSIDDRTNLVASAESLDRFTIKSRSEILYLLRYLIKRGELVTVHFNHGQDILLTTLLNAEADDDKLIFDWGGSEKNNQKLLKAERLFFVVAPDGIKIQFSTGQARQIDFGGENAFFADLPDEVIRLQRRDYYRVAAHGEGRMIASFLLRGKDQKLPLHDVGIGGIGLIMSRNDLYIEIGDILSDLILDIPGLETSKNTLEVRHVTLITPARGQPYTRIGCQNVGERRMSDEAKIQRYMIRIEQDRHALAIEKGFDTVKPF